MAQAQAAANATFLDRVQIYLENRSVASIYGPLVFLLFTFTYLYVAVTISKRSELWMDEVLAVSTAQLPNWNAMFDAMWGGTAFAPPTYYILLRETLAFGGFLPVQLAARLPSILAGLGAAVVVFVIMRRRVGLVISLVSFAIILSMGLFPFAVQAREYALLAFFLSLALLFWDGVENSRHPMLNGVGIWVALALCLSLHFHGIIDVATIAICEALWILTRRQLRAAVIVPLVCLIPVEIAWTPLARHLATFNAGDSSSLNFYAKPTIDRLFQSIDSVLLNAEAGITLIVVGALLVAVLYYARRLSGNPQWLGPTPPQRAPGALSRLEIMMIALALIPIITFLFAAVVTKAYSARYASGVTLLAGMGAGCVLGRLRDGRTVAVLLTPLLLLDLIHKTRAGTGGYAGILPILEHYTRDDSALPIVVDDGVFYLQAAYAADADMRSRMVLLTVPKEPPQDPTNQNQTVRSAQFVDYFHVAKLDDFLKTHPRFYLLSEMQTRAITVVPALMEACALGPLVAEINGKFLFRAGLSYAEQNCGKP
jgi:hypothetical protein